MQGTALAGYVWGYRAALLVSGAAAIRLATNLGWHGVFVVMAALTLIGPIVTLMAREPALAASLVRELGAKVSFARRFARSVAEPLREFLSRRGATAILAFIVLFRLGEALAGTMLPPFYRHLGYDRAQVALANGPVSLVAVLVGAAVGGWLVARIGTGRALLITGSFQTLCMGMYVLLSYSAGSHAVLILTAAVESGAEGLADAAFITYLSGLCDRRHTATQYALLSSVAALALRTVGGTLGLHGSCPRLACLLRYDGFSDASLNSRHGLPAAALPATGDTRGSGWRAECHRLRFGPARRMHWRMF